MRGYWFGDGRSGDHCGDKGIGTNGCPWSDIHDGDNWWRYNNPDDSGFSTQNRWRWPRDDEGYIPGYGRFAGDGPTQEEE